jgi:phenylpropionate dioxygenase-like ring-hydroxylating dioxygenase large terminal subunit
MASTLSPAASAILATGLRNRWYALCPSSMVTSTPTSFVRLGIAMVMWRDEAGEVHVQEDYCPHRGAPLSQGRVTNGRIECAYHGLQIDAEGVVQLVPGMPGCKLEGQKAVRTFPAKEIATAVFAWIGDAQDLPVDEFIPSERLTTADGDRLLCYVEWNCPYRFVIDNLMDPMHGSYLHRKSHTMYEGDLAAEFAVRKTEHGLMFEKTGQRDVSFDWSEWFDRASQWIELEIPYPPSGGPGGNFGIVAHTTPIDETRSAVFFWRTRPVTGWHRNVWRFLYKNRLEARHWHVLEQDRIMAEAMRPDADKHEYLYEHDLGLSRVRRVLRVEAESQAAATEALSEGTGRR